MMSKFNANYHNCNIVVAKKIFLRLYLFDLIFKVSLMNLYNIIHIYSILLLSLSNLTQDFRSSFIKAKF
jgi:hypothetical protein